MAIRMYKGEEEAEGVVFEAPKERKLYFYGSAYDQAYRCLQRAGAAAAQLNAQGEWQGIEVTIAKGSRQTSGYAEHLIAVYSACLCNEGVHAVGDCASVRTSWRRGHRYSRATARPMADVWRLDTDTSRYSTFELVKSHQGGKEDAIPKFVNQ